MPLEYEHAKSIPKFILTGKDAEREVYDKQTFLYSTVSRIFKFILNQWDQFFLYRSPMFKINKNKQKAQVVLAETELRNQEFQMGLCISQSSLKYNSCSLEVADQREKRL